MPDAHRTKRSANGAELEAYLHGTLTTKGIERAQPTQFHKHVRTSQVRCSVVVAASCKWWRVFVHCGAPLALAHTASTTLAMKSTLCSLIACMLLCCHDIQVTLAKVFAEDAGMRPKVLHPDLHKPDAPTLSTADIDGAQPHCKTVITNARDTNPLEPCYQLATW